MADSDWPAVTVPQTRHASDIACLRLSEDKQIAVTGDVSGIFRAWSVFDRKLLKVLPPPDDVQGVLATALSPSGRYLFVNYFYWWDLALVEGATGVWDVLRGQYWPIGEKQLHEAVRSVAREHFNGAANKIDSGNIVGAAISDQGQLQLLVNILVERGDRVTKLKFKTVDMLLGAAGYEKATTNSFRMIPADIAQKMLRHLKTSADPQDVGGQPYNREYEKEREAFRRLLPGGPVSCSVGEAAR